MSKCVIACLHRRRGRDKTLVCSCVHTANSTRQDSLVASPIVFAPSTRTHRIETRSRRDKTVLSRRVGGVNKPLQDVSVDLFRMASRLHAGHSILSTPVHHQGIVGSFLSRIGVHPKEIVEGTPLLPLFSLHSLLSPVFPLEVSP